MPEEILDTELSPEELAAQADANKGGEPGEPGKPGEGRAPGEGGEQNADNKPAGDVGKPKKTAQERINELTFKFRSTERELEHWKELAEANATKVPKATSKPSDRPTAINYETVEEYEDALNGWYDTKRSKAAQEKEGLENQRTAFANFNKNAAKLREAHEDFDAAIKAPIFTDAMRSVIFSIENGPMIAYHLGKHPEVANEIKGLSPERQMYEISKLEGKLLLATKGKQITNAPNPITPVGDTGGPETDPETMTTPQWMAWDKKRTLAKLKAKLQGPKV